MSNIEFTRTVNDKPIGYRESKCPSEIRASMTTLDGKQFVQVEGYASVFERAYPMYDSFGPYDEIMSRNAFDRSLAAKPDVSFLVNHTGVSLARTVNRTLEVSADSTGLHVRAMLNPTRSDVSDLMSAVNDGLITEMSFAFMLNDGAWNDDLTEFRIREADIHRGDVSAVNYGANPFTSIEARAFEWLDLAEKMPAPVRREVLRRLADDSETSARLTGLPIHLLRRQTPEDK